jgi:hypothetical protein
LAFQSIHESLSIPFWYLQFKCLQSTRRIESMRPVHLNYEQHSRSWLPILSTVVLLLIDWRWSITFWCVRFENVESNPWEPYLLITSSIVVDDYRSIRHWSCYRLIGACRLPSIDWSVSSAFWYVQIEYPVSTRPIESVRPVHLNYEQRSRRWLPILSTVVLLAVDWSLSSAFWFLQFEYLASTRQIIRVSNDYSSDRIRQTSTSKLRVAFSYIITDPFDTGLGIDWLELVDCFLIRAIQLSSVRSLERIRENRTCWLRVA